MEDTWVVIVIASRYWYNYRHAADGYAVYDIAKSMGVRDDHILLLDAADLLHSPRNAAKGEVHAEASVAGEFSRDLIRQGAEIDYRGEQVSVSLLVNLLLGRRQDSLGSQLRSSAQSNVLLYLSGHGGDEFFKFHDVQELDALDFAQTIAKMHASRRYGQLLVILDTCQASTMAHHLESPNVTFLASSKLGENSYGLHMNEDLAVSSVDRFTYSLYQFLRKSVVRDVVRPDRRASVHDLFQSFRPSFLFSTPLLQQSPNSSLSPREMRLAEFFGPASLPSSVETIQWHERLVGSTHDDRGQWEEISWPIQSGRRAPVSYAQQTPLEQALGETGLSAGVILVLLVLSAVLAFIRSSARRRCRA